jgi:hypothetical protein
MTDDLREVLADPAAVHVNMLRGGIAKPTVAQIWHLYGAELLAAMPAEHLSAALRQVEQRAYERAAQMAKTVDLFDGDRLKNSDPRVTISTAIRALATLALIRDTKGEGL